MWWWVFSVFCRSIGPPCLKADFLSWLLGQLTQSPWLTSLKPDQRACCSSCSEHSDHPPFCCTTHAAFLLSTLLLQFLISDIQGINTSLPFQYNVVNRYLLWWDHIKQKAHTVTTLRCKNIKWPQSTIKASCKKRIINY